MWGRVAGGVAKTLALEEAKPTESSLSQFVMLVAYQNGKPAIIRLTTMDRMDVLIRRELNQGRTVVMLGLSGVMKTLQERLAAFETRSASG